MCAKYEYKTKKNLKGTVHPKIKKTQSLSPFKKYGVISCFFYFSSLGSLRFSYFSSSRNILSPWQNVSLCVSFSFNFLLLEIIFVQTGRIRLKPQDDLSHAALCTNTKENMTMFTANFTCTLSELCYHSWRVRTLNQASQCYNININSHNINSHKLLIGRFQWDF